MEKIFLVSIYFLISLVIAVGLIFIHYILSEKAKQNFPDKFLPFESGMTPLQDVRGRFPVKFYVFALAFLIFDIEIALLLPYIPVVRELGLIGLVEVFIFFGVLLLAYIYVREIALKERI